MQSVSCGTSSHTSLNLSLSTHIFVFNSGQVALLPLNVAYFIFFQINIWWLLSKISVWIVQLFKWLSYPDVALLAYETVGLKFTSFHFEKVALHSRRLLLCLLNLFVKVIVSRRRSSSQVLNCFGLRLSNQARLSKSWIFWMIVVKCEKIEKVITITP